jgi:outer membrane protein TolC
MTRNEYNAGQVDYASVVLAQAAARAARNSELTVEAERLTTAVDLTAALGGGWTTAQQPKL